MDKEDIEELQSIIFNIMNELLRFLDTLKNKNGE